MRGVARDLARLGKQSGPSYHESQILSPMTDRCRFNWFVPTSEGCNTAATSQAYILHCHLLYCFCLAVLAASGIVLEITKASNGKDALSCSGAAIQERKSYLPIGRGAPAWNGMSRLTIKSKPDLQSDLRCKYCERYLYCRPVSLKVLDLANTNQPLHISMFDSH